MSQPRDELKRLRVILSSQTLSCYNGLVTTISIEEIQQDLLSYLRRVEAGETVVVTRGGEPVAEIKPVAHEAKQLRPFGLCAGEFTLPEDFDAPLPEQILRQFEAE